VINHSVNPPPPDADAGCVVVDVEFGLGEVILLVLVALVVLAPADESMVFLGKTFKAMRCSMYALIY